MTEGEDAHPAGRLVEHTARALALCGGILLLAAGGTVTASVLLRWLAGNGINGDFEMMEMATALAVFAFLPFCQARRGNIMVDTFTGWMPPHGRRLLDALWDLAWAAFAALIAWQAFKGGLEEISYGTTSMSAGIPVGPMIVATALLAAVLAVVTLVTAVRLLIGRS
jgi:TRAP-type C4-dicarboxylate transport system permease small subunit